ncbi:MAG TPA: polymer-forming cytoskeletal protein [Bryobacteraceae bacterium]|nr:polymer-forming cytoskeletal protein [Bryobacteraceae bacterium]
MWSRRKEEEYTPKQTHNPPPQADLIKEGTPMSTTLPSRNVEPESYRTSSSAASIGKSVMIKGQIISREDLYLDGELEGTVELQEHRLTIGPNGRVAANVKAREIVVIGSMHGNCEASDKVEIRKEAKLVGDIRTSRIFIEDGAYFKGSIDIVKQDVGKPQPAPPAPAPARVQQAVGASAGAGASNQISEVKR